VRINEQEFNEEDALIRLVSQHGLRVDTAKSLLKCAADRRYKLDPTYTCYVKYAGPYLFETQSSAPEIPPPYMGQEQTRGGFVTSQPAQQNFLPVPSMQPDPSALSRYNVFAPDPNILQAVQMAAATGQKEIFDTSMISALLSATQQDMQVDRFIGPLMVGLDALARILLSLYWHNKTFAERYGKDDVASLEDMLRNTFINLGKLVLNLMQKSIEDPFDLQRDLDLTTASQQ
jgi:hypothetical protein